MAYTRIKTEAEIKDMRIAGKMLATVLEHLRGFVVPGVTTKEIADEAARELKKLGGKPSFLGMYGFPDVICISVNDEIVHGIPRTTKLIADGDIVSLDFGVTYNNMITDGAISVFAGKPKLKRHEELVRATEESMYAGISVLRHGIRTEDIGAAVQEVLDKHSLGIVRDLVGHGVGHDLHEEPNIPNYGKKGRGEQLEAGMTIAIEPMATLGDYKVVIDPDKWTIRTQDGTLSAHFENTVLITQDGAEILTKV
jgi:methionyl aminopeptidase